MHFTFTSLLEGIREPESSYIQTDEGIIIIYTDRDVHYELFVVELEDLHVYITLPQVKVIRSIIGLPDTVRYNMPPA